MLSRLTFAPFTSHWNKPQSPRPNPPDLAAVARWNRSQRGCYNKNLIIALDSRKLQQPLVYMEEANLFVNYCKSWKGWLKTKNVCCNFPLKLTCFKRWNIFSEGERSLFLVCVTLFTFTTVLQLFSKCLQTSWNLSCRMWVTTAILLVSKAIARSFPWSIIFFCAANFT